MAEHDEITNVLPGGQFEFYPLRVSRIIRETKEACSLVFDIPEQLRQLFQYRAGQYLTLQIDVDGAQLERCYSLSSSPETDAGYKVTVKAVAGGRMSNWINRRLAEADVISVMPPNGRFCLQDNKADLLLFCAGSGITPCISLLKTALATDGRKVTMLYANRDRDSVIFDLELKDLMAEYGDRFQLIESLDSEKGFVTGEDIEKVARNMAGADCFICGPNPFMSVVETALVGAGFDRHRIFVEQFLLDEGEADTAAIESEFTIEFPDSVTFIVNGREIEVPYTQGETLLDCAREEGVRLPSSCRIGSCATCMARVVEGSVEMRINHVLDDSEIEEGYVLVCQGVPVTRRVVIKYEL